MARNLKALGLAMLPVLALAAVAASGAQAELMFEAESYPATTTTHNVEVGVVITTSSVTAECKTHHTHSETPATSTEVTMHTTTKSCVLASFEATANMKSCFYTFALASSAESPYPGTTAIACEEEGDAIEIGNLLCTITTAPQEGLEGVTFANIGEGSERELAMNMEVSGIAYSQKGLCGNETGSNATLSGSGNVEGYDEEGQPIGLWVGE